MSKPDPRRQLLEQTLKPISHERAEEIMRARVQGKPVPPTEPKKKPRDAGPL